ncbi:hypothetical protein [Streptosporangium sp. KLBMP 9127]|nr:hypothetical protein [Streptosporangium sp. KLBMP 9127]
MTYSLSADWLVALATRLEREVSDLIAGSATAGKDVATFALDGRVRFASAATRAAFAEELTSALSTLVSKYHDEAAEGGREHRLIVAIHSQPKNKFQET